MGVHDCWGLGESIIRILSMLRRQAETIDTKKSATQREEVQRFDAERRQRQIIGRKQLIVLQLFCGAKVLAKILAR